MSFYFRDKPKLGEKLRGRSSDELLQEIKQQFDEDSKSFFEPTGGGRSSTRDPFERHTVFPRGFPFDDEGFGRRSDIRTHLDQLAARHPEFADHLLGPAWGDIPFHGSLRGRNRRGSGNGSNNNYQGYSDEDARSQASGSSAASGASAVSSHGESEGSRNNHRERSRDEPDTDHRQTAGKSQIPQYGFRNTVDIGQHRHNMENPDKGNRGQRSMSAPPENRQQFCQQQPHQCHHNCQQQQFQPQPQPQSQFEQQPRPQQGQRYVSRIDITPQHNQPQQPQSQFQQPQQQQQPQSQQPQQKPASQQQGNVRHIPIFVEGRDEPVLPRSSDEPYFRREPSPTQFHAPPHFQRSSAFGQSPFARSHQWSPPFQDPFYPTQTGYEQPSSRRQQQQTHGFQHPRQQQQPQSPPQQYEKQPQPQQHREQYAQHHPQQQPSQQQPSQQHEQQEASPPRPKPVVPKDPLERVAMVQKEVDSLAEQVKLYSGSSRKDKQYVYLDEMLTRELIKLDDIETEGRENVRQARRNAIKTIQETIGLLESKAPLASQPATPQQTEKPIIPTAVEQFESMDVDRKEGEQQTNEAIPLPPGPSSPLNNPGETVQEEKEQEEETKKSTATDAEQPSNPIDDGASVEPMDTTCPVLEKSEEKPAEPTPMDVQESSEGSNVEVKKTLPESKEAKIETNVPEENAQADEKKMENDSSSATSDVVPAEKPSSRETAAAVESDITAPTSKDNDNETREADKTVKQSPKTPKKGKKTKKQSTASASVSTAPVSDTPIPLPPPESAETNGK